jgi:hypothetical protein
MTEPTILIRAERVAVDGTTETTVKGHFDLQQTVAPGREEATPCTPIGVRYEALTAVDGIAHRPPPFRADIGHRTGCLHGTPTSRQQTGDGTSAAACDGCNDSREKDGCDGDVDLISLARFPGVGRLAGSAPLQLG